MNTEMPRNNIERDIEKNLLLWKTQKPLTPLILRGTRKVGKTHTVETFARQHFERLVAINFELQPEMIKCFDSLDPIEILNSIFILTQKKVAPEKTLLFLDEIQECPNALRALRYFKEKLPQQHVIAATSSFEPTPEKIPTLHLKPFSFKEYLVAKGEIQLRELIENFILKTSDLKISIKNSVHDRLLNLTREYMALGGMPAVLKSYFASGDLSECQNIQMGLLNTYRQEFGKYAKKSDYKYVHKLFEKAPGLVGRNFKYSQVDATMRSRDIKDALQTLQNAGLIYPVYSSSANNLPLANLMNEKKFKILFFDVGLMTRANKLEKELLFNENLLSVYRGSLAEQFVGQELLAYASPSEKEDLFFWSREKSSSMAEVDYISAISAAIIPIEVKAGTIGTLKSMQLFMTEKKVGLGVRFSQQPLSYNKKILSLPLYMISEMQRIVKNLL